ncbi:hypothetical protein C8F01DRAFT_1212350 [Mycena amicta]|nr:hypothetical protein C8F01DRAFT_1212350 [Mycena amicta]
MHNAGEHRGPHCRRHHRLSHRIRTPLKAILLVALKDLPSPEEYNKRKVALISGITGQDGSYLTELLLSKGYQVHGIIRRSSSFNTGRRTICPGKFKLHYGDLSDSTNLVYIIAQVQPSEIYKPRCPVARQGLLRDGGIQGDVDGLGTLRLLDAVRTCGLEKHVRFYQASTSELARTTFYPRSPYGCAKLYAYWIVVNYREAYGFYACNGILFNHESLEWTDVRDTQDHACGCGFSLGKQSCLYLGNIDAKRDWGHARDYVEGMWLMLQQPQAEDFVLATGETHPVREFVELAFGAVGVQLEWSGSGVDEQATDKKTGKVVVKIDPQYFRPAEVELLLGTPAKAERVLGWKRKVDFPSLVREMVEADVKASKSMVEDQN